MTATNQKISIYQEKEAEMHSIITEISFMQHRFLGNFMYKFLCIITLGVYYAFSKSYQFLNIYVCYKPCKNIEDANVILIKFDDETNEIAELIKLDRNFIAVIRYMRYVWNSDKSMFEPLFIDFNDKSGAEILSAYKKGLEEEKVVQERKMYGVNEMNIPIKSIPSIIIEEMFSLFYLFQWFCFFIWILDEYVYFALALASLSFYGIASNTYIIRKNQKRMKDLTHHSVNITVVRRQNATSGKRELILNSTDLVPGDVIQIPTFTKLPCDILLISGTCIMNESSLTGESVPVNKTSINKFLPLFQFSDCKKNILFAGTSCFQTKKVDNKPVAGIVLRTGFSTEQGKLIRSMLYPKIFTFYYDQQSLLVLYFLFLFSFGLCAYTIYFFIHSGTTSRLAILKGLELFTDCISPTIPTCMTVGLGFSLLRLEKKKIFSINSKRINMAGRVRLMCFDKTGTLTEDNITIKSVVGVTVNNDGIHNFGVHEETAHHFIKSSKKFEEEVNEENNCKCSKAHVVAKETLNQLLIQGLASCTSLTYVNWEIIGDPLDIANYMWTSFTMFENPEKKANDWESIIQPPQSYIEKFGGNNESNFLYKYRELDFSSDFQRMSVIVKKNQNSNFWVFTKGSPEKIKDICDPKTIPADYDKKLKHLTKKGYRIIAFAFGALPTLDANEVQLVKREAVEQNLTFLGFVIGENKLKKITKSCINDLIEGGITNKMITGDNINTAIHVALECNIIQLNSNIYFGDLSKKNGSEVKWKKMDMHDDEYTKLIGSDFEENEPFVDILSSTTNILKSLYPLVQESNKSKKDSEKIPVYFAVTGSAFDLILDEFTKSQDKELYELVINKIAVLARMTPHQKINAVKMFQDIYQKRREMVGFCGDGANDSGALKQADIGLSLSDTEASIAAPFSSQVKDISAVISLLKEGRCALATSFQSFKYICFLCVTLTVAVFSLYLFYQEYTNIGYYVFSYYSLLLLSFLISTFSPRKHFSPEIPSDKLIEPIFIISAIGYLIIIIVYFSIGLKLVQTFEGYEAITVDDFGNSSDAHYENTLIFILSLSANIGLILAVVKGRPFKQSLYKNKLLITALAILGAFNFIISIRPSERVQTIFNVDTFENEDLWKVQVMNVTICLIIVIYERLILDMIEKFTKIIQKQKKLLQS